MKSVKVKTIEIGNGIPKICVPVVGRNENQIMDQIEEIKKVPFDILELRIDWFEGCCDHNRVQKLLMKLRQQLGEKPILFTFRSRHEGGELEVEFATYEQLLLMAADSGLVDLIDVEVFWNQENLGACKELIQNIRKRGTYVVASNHDFHKTPTNQDMIHRLEIMKDMGADIAKLALMPENHMDILRVLEITQLMQDENFGIPVVTMSMGAAGRISRIAGEVFGSAITFASVEKSSAPGQIPANDLHHMLQVLHQ